MTKDNHQCTVYSVFDRSLRPINLLSGLSICLTACTHLDATFHLQLVSSLLMIESSTSIKVQPTILRGRHGGCFRSRDVAENRIRVDRRIVVF